MKKILIILLIVLNCCGGSSSDSANIEVLSPAENSSFKQGEVISYSLSLSNFNLAPPFNLRSISFAKDHGQDSHTDSTDDGTQHEDSEHEHESEEEHQHETDDIHDHGGLNPDANEGHYHVYLNEASGDDHHLTLWTETGEYELPQDIATGQHSLRFELRDNNHTPVGVETYLFFAVVP